MSRPISMPPRTGSRATFDASARLAAVDILELFISSTAAGSCLGGGSFSVGGRLEGFVRIQDFEGQNLLVFPVHGALRKVSPGLRGTGQRGRSRPEGEKRSPDCFAKAGAARPLGGSAWVRGNPSETRPCAVQVVRVRAFPSRRRAGRKPRVLGHWQHARRSLGRFGRCRQEPFDRFAEQYHHQYRRGNHVTRNGIPADQDVQQAVLFSGETVVLANVPSPARYALHKLIVYGERKGAYAAKSAKDIQQAAFLLSRLKELRPSDIAEAWRDLIGRSPGWRSRARNGVEALSRQFPELGAKELLGEAPGLAVSVTRKKKAVPVRRTVGARPRKKSHP